VLSPTGLKIRGEDKWGSGAFKAPRGDHVHRGVDFVCVPGQSVAAPIEGVIRREARPYVTGEFSGVLIESPVCDVKLFYLKPDPTLIGRHVKKGQVIGHAQDISQKYPGITPHVHLEITMINPGLLLDMP